MRWFVGIILCISLCVGHISTAADSSSAPADKGAANFHDAYQKWLTALAETAKLQTQMVAASSSDREAVRLKFSDAVHTAEAMLPDLQAAAEVAYAADDTNKDLANLMFVIAMGHLRKDNYEESLRLGRLLLE